MEFLTPDQTSHKEYSEGTPFASAILNLLSGYFRTNTIPAGMNHYRRLRLPAKRFRVPARGLADKHITVYL
jgi:hypothetical protein